MPFSRQDDLPPNPSVRIFFIGLNILKLVNDTNIQAFVHNRSPEHKLTIEARRKRTGKPDQLMMRHTGPLFLTGADPTHTHGFIIRTDGLPAGTKGVKAYIEVVKSNEGTSLFDCFVLERLLGKSPGAVEQGGGTPSISIDHGVFYTADKVVTKAQFVKSGSTPIPLNEVPTIIGANIYLNPAVPAQMVTLFWRQEGRDVFLPLPQVPGSSYEIYIINEPLFEEISPTLPRHGEFTEYFRILPDIGGPDQFEIEFLEEIPHRGSTRAPCMSVLYGG